MPLPGVAHLRGAAGTDGFFFCTCLGRRERMATRVGSVDSSSLSTSHAHAARIFASSIQGSGGGAGRRATGRGAEVRVQVVTCTRTVCMLASSSLTMSCMKAPRCIEREAWRSTAAQSPSTGTSCGAGHEVSRRCHGGAAQTTHTEGGVGEGGGSDGSGGEAGSVAEARAEAVRAVRVAAATAPLPTLAASPCSRCRRRRRG